MHLEWRLTLDDKCPTRSTVGGRPNTAYTAEKVDQERHLITTSRRVTISDIVNTLDISHKRIHGILYGHLHMHYNIVNAMWTSYNPTVERNDYSIFDVHRRPARNHMHVRFTTNVSNFIRLFSCVDHFCTENDLQIH